MYPYSPTSKFITYFQWIVGIRYGSVVYPTKNPDIPLDSYRRIYVVYQLEKDFPRI